MPAAGQPFMAEPDFGTGKNVVLPFEELRRREERYRGRQIDAANRRISRQIGCDEPAGVSATPGPS